MRLRNQDFNHVTTHTFTLNQSITHTIGNGSNLGGFTFYYDSLSTVDRTKDSMKTRQRSAAVNQGNRPPVSDVQF